VINAPWWIGAAESGAAKDAFDVLDKHYSARGGRPSQVIEAIQLESYVPLGNPEFRQIARSAVPRCRLRHFPWQSSLYGFASWLHRLGNQDYHVLVDWRRVSAIAKKRIDIILTHLLLHEFGHLYYHKGLLFRGPKARANPAGPKEEDEAWVFASAFFGICLGDYANYCCGPKGLADTGWLYL